MFCRYCGNNIEGDSVFCEVCGKRLREEPVAQVPVVDKTTQLDTNSPLYYYNNAVADTKPLEQTMEREYHASKYERMSGFSGSLPNEPHEPSQKIEYKRAPDEPLKPKKKKGKGKLPYVLLPIGVVIAGVIAILTGSLTELFVWQVLDLDFYLAFVAESVLRTTTYLIILILFSLCCKGLNKKLRFVLSGYAGIMGHFLVRILLIIVGYIVLYAVGYHDYTGYEIFYTANQISEYLGIFPSAILSLIWFIASEKYEVNRQLKSKTSKKTVPAILLGVYMFIAFLINGVLNVVIARGLTDLFGEWGSNFAWRLAWLIVNAISIGLLFVFAIPCRGSYKKLTFVGSALFSIALFEPVMMLMDAIVYGGLYDVFFEEITSFGIIENLLGSSIYIPQYLLAIPVAIIFYILLNRYTVEKIKKRA